MIVSTSWITTLLFITIRMGTILLFTPIQAIRQIPVHSRLIFIFIFSVLMSLNTDQVTEMENPRILLGGIAEFANGLILATSMFAAFSVFQIAGQIIENETGMNSLTLFNPSEHSQLPLTSHLLSMLAVLFFFGLNGHIWLFKGLSYSFVIIPPGTLSLFNGFVPVMKQLGFMFSMAVMIASPIITSLLVIDLFSAVLTRNMPQISTYFLMIPIKVLLALVLLGLMLNYFNPIANQVFEHCFQTWQEIMS
ncbi:flagellar biosynthetic protein FliR [uncultured Legionella sp.]|uniref:flagellar biosynthetic protein FliR n=1 Tax=uncultured Legionella sp. TaxID=210934 RepID=UPI00261D356C|nr:flagellar biosynthetic protein FliR [uncultured Legionella sp.]